MASKLSACIIAMNEEDRIADCIRSLDFCDEVLVVDSHSTDRTREVAADLGARVIERDWPGHVAQKEFTIRQAKNDWVLCLDADERVSPALREEILAAGRNFFTAAPGWQMPRMSWYLGKWIRHGTWYPDLQLRLFDRRRGRWTGMNPHDRVEIDGRPLRFRHEIRHYPYRSISEHLHTIDNYTSIMARELHARGKRASVLDLFTHPLGRFLKFYVLEAGFLDGWRGLLLACLAAHYAQMKYAKLFIAGMERPQR